MRLRLSFRETIIICAQKKQKHSKINASTRRPTFRRSSFEITLNKTSILHRALIIITCETYFRFFPMHD